MIRAHAALAVRLPDMVDDQAFAAGTPETELADLSTVLMGGGPLSNKRGHALLTNDRLLFSDQRFAPAQAGAIGGPLAGALAEALERRRRGRPPLLDFPLTDIARVSHVTKLTVRDILVIDAGGTEYRFAQGFKAWNPLLRRVLAERHGRPPDIHLHEPGESAPEHPGAITSDSLRRFPGNGSSFISVP